MSPRYKYILPGFLAALVLLFLVYVFCSRVVVEADAPPCCDPARLSPAAAKFAAGAHVTVTISSALTADERADIISGFEDWNRENANNQSAVVYGPFITGEVPILSDNQQFVGYQDPLPGACAQEHINSSGKNVYGTMYFAGCMRYGTFPNEATRSAFRKSVTRHEIGHAQHLADTYNCPLGSTIMFAGANAVSVITSCDNEAVCDEYGFCPRPSRTPTATPIQPSCPFAVPVELDGSCPFGYFPDGTVGVWCCPEYGGCNQPANPDGTCSTGFVNSGGTCTRSLAFQSQCFSFGDYDFESCSCTGSCDGGGCSPIVVDVLGDGFALTNVAHGVNFDLNNDGFPELRSWTEDRSDDAWLVLDRNHNGIIDQGKEMFGNTTPQLSPTGGEQMNGFRALALYDGFGYGGNGDGEITEQDAIFRYLKLWQDKNHNGVSESCELFTLQQLGIAKIDLDYRLSNRVDQYGNQFRFRSKVRDMYDAQIGRWAWDVYLLEGTQFKR